MTLLASLAYYSLPYTDSRLYSFLITSMSRTSLFPSTHTLTHSLCVFSLSAAGRRRPPPQLMDAVKEGQLDLMMELLRTGANINSTDEVYRVVLSYFLSPGFFLFICGKSVLFVLRLWFCTHLNFLHTVCDKNPCLLTQLISPLSLPLLLRST